MIDNQSLDWNKESLRELRLRMGWSRSDLARRLNCSTELIESFEEGRLSVTALLRGELELLWYQAEACCEEVRYTPVAENELEKTSLEQIDFSRLKAELE